MDYWQSRTVAQRGLKNRFGVRVSNGRCWALIQMGDKDPIAFGGVHTIPVDLSMLPSYLRMIVDNHQLNHMGSDLVEVLTGQKPFPDAADSPTQRKRMTATRSVRLPHAS
jgi:hypothetical protein